MDIKEVAANDLNLIRKNKPLVHNITNYVVMNYTANALLAMGASPVMAHSIDEVEEMVSLANSLVLNIGTLSKEWIDSMIKAGKKANDLKIPIILDPVGAGATKLRTESSLRILDNVKVSVVRGNASEILSLSSTGGKTKGVDSLHRVEEAEDLAKSLAKELNTTVAITGKVDSITDGKRNYRCFNGHPMMGKVTGTGCSATVIIGAFLAVEKDPLLASIFGLAFFGLAGEKASLKASSPGSFGIALLDALHDIDEKTFIEGIKLETS